MWLVWVWYFFLVQGLFSAWMPVTPSQPVLVLRCCSRCLGLELSEAVAAHVCPQDTQWEWTHSHFWSLQGLWRQLGAEESGTEGADSSRLLLKPRGSSG